MLQRNLSKIQWRQQRTFAAVSLACIFLMALTASASALQNTPTEQAADDIVLFGLEPQISTESSQEIIPAGFGDGNACYTGCYTAQQSQGMCPSGQVARLTVSGPTWACYIADWTCVSTCSGPLVTPAGFYPYCSL